MPLLSVSMLAACSPSASHPGELGESAADAAPVPPAPDGGGSPPPKQDASADGSQANHDASPSLDAAAPSDAAVSDDATIPHDASGSDADIVGDASPSEDASDGADPGAVDGGPDGDAGCEPTTLLCVGGLASFCASDGTPFPEAAQIACDPSCTTGEWQGEFLSRVHRRGSATWWTSGPIFNSWGPASAYCKDQGGRLPTIAELKSLVFAPGRCHPAVDQVAFDLAGVTPLWSSELAGDARVDAGSRKPVRVFDFDSATAGERSAYEAGNYLCVF